VPRLRARVHAAECASELLLASLRAARLRPTRPAVGTPPRGPPPYEQLVREIEALGYSGVGRKYGVSDNAIRKWRRAYEEALASAPGREVPPGAAR